ncbi:hypothetical protein C8A03DRAFT_14017 [Achaetomium macrosporum]|uniref:Uncharacterized protein n=1 Tax=Achaetomium macrosporum TaxID=79813 RepID=A0AAN7CER7_9PEZI|nr:hypothetical protein C8A03DRAFT_14017 [Achaetomium macrosporum]
MMLLSEPQDCLSLAESAGTGRGADSPSDGLPAPTQNQDQVMQELSQMPTSVALSQGWSFAGVADDQTSANSVNSGIAQLLSQQDRNVAGPAKLQKAVPESPCSDTTQRQTSETQLPTQTSPIAAQTTSSEDTTTLVSTNFENSDDDDNDILAALHKCKIKGVRPSHPVAKQTPSFSKGNLTTSTPFNNASNGLLELASFGNLANGGTTDAPSTNGASGTARSSFLAKYDYCGRKREGSNHNSLAGPRQDTGPQGTSTPRPPSKRPIPEVIDLTELPDNPDVASPISHREGKRRKRDKHGREKQHRLEQSGGGKPGPEPLRSTQRERRQQVHEETHPEPPQESAQQVHMHHQGLRPTLARDGDLTRRQEPPHAIRPELHQKVHAEIRQEYSQDSQLGRNSETANPTGYGLTTVGERARRRIEDLKAKARRAATHNLPAAGSRLGGATPEDDADLFQKLSSKQPEKRITQLISSLPNSNRQRDPGSYPRARESVELPEPSQLVRPRGYLPATPAVNGQAGQLTQSSRIDVTQSHPTVQSRYSLQARTDIPPNRTRSAHIPFPLRRHQRNPDQQPPTQLVAQAAIQKERQRETVPILKALSPDRTVIQYIVYRTRRFTPHTTTITASSSSSSTNTPFPPPRDLRNHRGIKEQPIRCSAHPSPAQANAAAARRQDALRKGVVSKSWRMVPSSSSYSSYSSSTADETMQMLLLYEGCVGFDGGEVQFFWIGEEAQELGTLLSSGANGAERRRGGGAEPKPDAGETGSETGSDRSSPYPGPRTRASSVSTVNFSSHMSPLDLLDIATELHGTYTTLVQANRAALSTFLELAKPKNSRIEDHHHYQYEVKPGMTEAFEEGGYDERNCTTPAVFEWDAPMGGMYRWEFLRLVVEVVESELKGPVDLGDMVAEEGEVNADVDIDGGGYGEATRNNPTEAVLRSKPVAALPSPVEEGEVFSEEE